MNYAILNCFMNYAILNFLMNYAILNCSTAVNGSK